jgi:hypothetical protein
MMKPEMGNMLSVEPRLLVSRIDGLFDGEEFRPRNWCWIDPRTNDTTVINAAKAAIVAAYSAVDATPHVDAIRQLRVDSPNGQLAAPCGRTQC